MIETIEFNGRIYPKFQSEGFAAKFAIPFAQQVCVGNGVDVGCNRKEWAYVDRNGKPAMICDPIIDTECDALKLPAANLDYVFSSHMLEHVADWVKVLDYWAERLKPTGTLFLYLPHPNQSYWRPWHNRKHIHCFYPEMMKEYLTDRKWNKIFVSGEDLNSSFMVMAEK